MKSNILNKRVKYSIPL